MLLGSHSNVTKKWELIPLKTTVYLLFSILNFSLTTV